MTGNANHLQLYREFTTPGPVAGINGSLLAYSVGIIALIDDNNHIHELPIDAYVNDLEDFIVSKHWTKKQGLTASFDENE
jgi:hypothetical protein